MDKEEFIQACTEGGYSSKKTATEYSLGKNDFDGSDLVEAYRINERKLYLKNRQKYTDYRTYEGVRTTKKLKTIQSDENTEV